MEPNLVPDSKLWLTAAYVDSSFRLALLPKSTKMLLAKALEESIGK